MNWDKIKENFPLAMKLLADKWDLHYIKSINDVEYGLEGARFDLRDLFDFFDENLITVLLTCEFDFGFEILENRYESIIEVKKWYNSRKEAESAAFTKAFEILESKLK